jgi:hypothetical protein
MNRILLFNLFFILSLSSSAQNLTGIWRGYFIDDNMNQYKYEVQMEQTKKNTLSGITYSYRGQKFYGKSTMTGNFSYSSGNALIQEIKTIEVKMEIGSYTCIQKCLLTYAKSGREEFLEGTFTSIFEKTDSARRVLRGESCGGGRMYLRKVKTSDFYIEPFLRNKSLPKTEIPSVVKNNPPKTPPNKTSATKVPANQNTKSNAVANKDLVVAKPKTDPAKKADIAITKKEPSKNLSTKASVNVPAILTQRQTDLLQTILINSEEVIVKLFDNGEIDDDTISVYLDNQLVLSKKRLTASALTIHLKMDESNPEHELVMVAENLGRIPPNTSLMIVNAGDKRFEVRITSTEQKNALVRFRYVKPGKP